MNPAQKLYGRNAECQTLDRLMSDVRAARGRAMIVRGEVGAGKTALLDYLAGRAADAGCRVTRAAGVRSEPECAFAGLRALCEPLLSEAGRLPAPQRDALRTALGLATGPPPNPLLLGVAVLSLLSGMAADRPLICLVDDAQWLDRPSAQVLGFAARRLATGPVGLVLATRDPGGQLAGLAEVAIGGLTSDDAGALLRAALAGPLDPRVRALIVAETRGNPLALLELPRRLGPAELAGGFGLPDALPLPGPTEDGLDRELASLPAQTRRLVQLAAADLSGDASLVWRAARRLGIAPQAGTPAEEAGLVEFNAHVRFRQLSARWAAYRSASLPDRRRLHAALAQVTDPVADPDGRAWHRARAANGPDEEVARELERCTPAARAKGGLPAAAAFLERAAALTADKALHAQRTLAAAEASLLAGAFGQALDLVTAAEAEPLDELASARAGLLRGQVAAASGSDWLVPTAAIMAWGNVAWQAPLARRVKRARAAGALAQLPVLLDALGTAVAARGDLAGADALLVEADAVRAVTGARAAPVTAMILAALRGREAKAARLIGGQGSAVACAHWAAAILGNGLGRYQEALVAARQAMADGPAAPVSMRALPELVEAATRTGDAELAADALRQLGETIRGCGDDYALGLAARCRALLGDDADACYRESIDRLGRAGLRPELARSRLLYGEWLRREGRRADAREQLRTAHEMLTATGLAGFAERSRRELLATGATVRGRDVETVIELTAQEALIARLARDGGTNPEIGTQLFLSDRTVEYHLRKIYTKLGISSRRQLHRALAA
jgi:DNA-binding CsgD family transcriptional regulator/tetratricopeptide (TPR) repeat protein